MQKEYEAFSYLQLSSSKEQICRSKGKYLKFIGQCIFIVNLKQCILLEIVNMKYVNYLMQLKTNHA